MKLSEIKTATLPPNVAIVRLPPSEDEDGNPYFVQLQIRDGGVAEMGPKFTVKEGDSYRELNDCQVAIAYFNADDKSSRMLFSFTVLDDNGEPAPVRSMAREEFESLVMNAIQDFKRESH